MNLLFDDDIYIYIHTMIPGRRYSRYIEIFIFPKNIEKKKKKYRKLILL